MNIKKIILPVTALVAVVSVVVAGVFFVQAEQMKDKLGYEEHVLKSYATKEESTPETAVTAESAASDTDFADAVPVNTEDTTSAVNIIYDNGFKSQDSSVVLSDSENQISAVVSIPGENSIQYTTGDKTVIVNGSLKASVVKADEISFENVSKFETESGSILVVGQKKLNDATGLSVVYEVSNDEQVVTDAAAYVQTMIESAKVAVNNVQTMNVFGKQVSTSWNYVAVNEDYANFQNGDSNIYMSVFDMQLTGSGLDNSLGVDGLDIVYGSYKDSSTGLIPYVVKNSGGNVKVLASSNDILTGFFA